MPKQKIQLITGKSYHIVLRSVGNTVIFKNIEDYFRGIFSIYELNNAKPTTIQLRRKLRKSFKNKMVRGPTSNHFIVENDKREKLVEIIAFCFMPNHIHLLIKQIKDGGASEFMRKVGGGYAYYFNKKYNRKGHLFSQFKAFYIETQEQLDVVFAYILTNSISLIDLEYKEKGIKDAKKAIEFLEEEYRWSSYIDSCTDRDNFPSVINKELIRELIGDEKRCRELIINRLKYKEQPKDFDESILE